MAAAPSPAVGVFWDGSGAVLCWCRACPWLWDGVTLWCMVYWDGGAGVGARQDAGLQSSHLSAASQSRALRPLNSLHRTHKHLAVQLRGMHQAVFLLVEQLLACTLLSLSTELRAGHAGCPRGYQHGTCWGHCLQPWGRVWWGASCLPHVGQRLQIRENDFWF